MFYVGLCFVCVGVFEGFVFMGCLGFVYVVGFGALGLCVFGGLEGCGVRCRAGVLFGVLLVFVCVLIFVLFFLFCFFEFGVEGSVLRFGGFGRFYFVASVVCCVGFWFLSVFICVVGFVYFVWWVFRVVTSCLSWVGFVFFIGVLCLAFLLYSLGVELGLSLCGLVIFIFGFWFYLGLGVLFGFSVWFRLGGFGCVVWFGGGGCRVWF